jgi:hypothetical protein
MELRYLGFSQLQNERAYRFDVTEAGHATRPAKPRRKQSSNLAIAHRPVPANLMWKPLKWDSPKVATPRDPAARARISTRVPVV